MRVLFVSEGFDKSSIIAQPWRHMYEVANRFVAKGHDVAIATDSPPTNRVREIEVCDIPAYALPKIRIPPVMSPRMSPREVQAVIKEFSPGVIYWDGGALVGNYVRKVKGITKPIAVHVSTNLYTIKDLHFPIQEYRSIDRGFLIYAFTLSSPLAQSLVRLLNQDGIRMLTVPNRAIKEGLTKNGVFEDKIEILPNPFNNDGTFLARREQDSVKTREKIGLGVNDFVVAYFGPPQIYRGTDTLLYAVAKLRPKLPHLKLVMLLRPRAGYEDPHEKLLRKIVANLQLDKNVKFVSKLLRKKDLIEMVGSFDAVALPFKFLLNEPPITALEAMALGKALITTRVSGLPEIIGDDRGFLVEPGNENELAHAIHFIARNPKEAIERGRKAREYVSKLPEWNDYAEHILKLFEGMLN